MPERRPGSAVARRALWGDHRGGSTQGGPGAGGAEGGPLRQGVGRRPRRDREEAAAGGVHGRDRRGAPARAPHHHARGRDGRREGDHAGGHRRFRARPVARRTGGGRRAARAVQGAAGGVRPDDAVELAQRDLRPPARRGWTTRSCERRLPTPTSAALENPAFSADAPAKWKAGIVPRSVAKLKAAGVRFGMGDDAGATNGAQYFGFASHIEMASMVEAGLTPGRGDYRRDPQLGRVPEAREARHGGGGKERRLHRARRQPARRHRQYATDLDRLPAREGSRSPRVTRQVDRYSGH